jgi:hypothetical protein
MEPHGVGSAAAKQSSWPSNAFLIRLRDRVFARSQAFWSNVDLALVPNSFIGYRRPPKIDHAKETAAFDRMPNRQFTLSILSPPFRRAIAKRRRGLLGGKLIKKGQNRTVSVR